MASPWFCCTAAWSSTNLIWEGVPMAYASHMGTLANRFRVIAPDTRGCGRTPHGNGDTSYDQLADDVVALIDALGLETATNHRFQRRRDHGDNRRDPEPRGRPRDRQQRGT